MSLDTIDQSDKARIDADKPILSKLRFGIFAPFSRSSLLDVDGPVSLSHHFDFGYAHGLLLFVNCVLLVIFVHIAGRRFWVCAEDFQ
jgi:hypothetical protein